MQFRASGFFGFAGSFVALAALSVTELIPFALAWQQADQDLAPGLLIEAALEPVDSSSEETATDITDNEESADAWVNDDVTQEDVTQENTAQEDVSEEEVSQAEDDGDAQSAGEVLERAAPAIRAEAAKFNGVQPGISTAAQVTAAWGDSDKTIDIDGGVVTVYSMKPFDRIEVTIVDDVVASILIYLGRPFGLDDLTGRLKLGHVEAVDVIGNEGETLGRSFPELGVLFSFASGDGPREVAQIFMETIDAEPFVLRVRSNPRGRFAKNLRDLQFATSLDPDRAELHWLTAQMLLAVGEASRAEKAASRAVELEDNTEYRLTWVTCLARIGRHDQAIRETYGVLEAPDLSPAIKSRGLVTLGDLVASDDTRDYKAALDLHVEAIGIAEPLTRDPNVAVRRAAKEILIDANLSMALDIGAGRWRQKATVVPQWIERTTTYVDDMIDNEEGGLELRLVAARRALRALASFKPSVDPTALIDEAKLTADELTRGSSDPLQNERIYWELGVAYYHTLQIYHDRGEVDAGLKFGKLAEKYMRLGARNREITPDADQLVGRLYYQIGAVHAVLSQDHGEAVAWYEKTAKRLATPVSNSPVSTLRQQGEAIVSMGVSYWQTGELERAVEMTEEGVQIIEKAVVTGSLDQSVLSTSYGNLSAMHRELGNTEKAQYFSDLAAQSKGASPREARLPRAEQSSDVHRE